MKSKNRLIKLYSNLIHTWNVIDPKAVDKSEIVPPYVFEDQEIAGEVDYDGLMAETEFVRECLDEAITELVSQTKKENENA
jgi:putative methionine-R-sulfoxide reductase with GAF domain